jgi:Ca-activated chloride channel family protein
VADSASGKKTSPIRYLWARKWVDLLEDQTSLLPGDDELKEAITDLGLRYTILTSQTSFVAIDSEVVNKGGNQETVKQPLPLPEGVSNYAVGGAAQSVSGYAMPASPAPSGPYKKYKSMGSKGGGYNAPMAATEALASADVDESAKLVEKEEDDKKPGKVKSVTFTFSTKPSGKKLMLHKRKKLESIVKSIVESKVKSGKIPSGKTVYLTITIKLDADGKVSSVHVFGDPGYGLKKAIKAKLQSVKGYKKFDAIEMSVAVNAK